MHQAARRSKRERLAILPTIGNRPTRASVVTKRHSPVLWMPSPLVEPEEKLELPEER